MAEADRELQKALVRYVGYFYLAGLNVAAGLARRRSVDRLPQGTPGGSWPISASPLAIAFATDNPLAALYSAIEVLEERFGVDRSVVDTVATVWRPRQPARPGVAVHLYRCFFCTGLRRFAGTAAIVIVAALVPDLRAPRRSEAALPALVPILAPILLNAQIPDALAARCPRPRSPR